jgi:hypothetical protein
MTSSRVSGSGIDDAYLRQRRVDDAFDEEARS